MHSVTHTARSPLRSRLMPVLLTGLLVLISACTDYEDQTPIGITPWDDLNVAMMLDVSGTNQTVGNASWQAAFMAQEDRLASQPQNSIASITWGFDTMGQPTVAGIIADTLNFGGNQAQLVIGPTASDVADALAWSLDPIPPEGGANVPIFISPSSSAIALEAVDNMLRLSPSDRLQAEAITEFMKNSPFLDLPPSYLSVAVMYPVGSSWAEDMASTVGEQLMGNDVLPFGYTINSLPQVMADADAFLEPDAGVTGAVDFVLFLGGHQDGATYFEMLNDFPTLSTTDHLCGSALTLSQAVSVAEPASSNAAAVHLTGVLYDHDYSEAAGDVQHDLAVRLGYTPDPWALNAYDAYMLLDAYSRIYEPIVITLEDDPGKVERIIRQELMDLAAISTGVTGPLDLDENGDRLYATHEYWTLSDGTWTETGTYHRDESGSTSLTLNE